MAFPVSGSRRRTIFIAVLLSVTLITLDVRGNPAIDRVRGFARDAFSPFRGAARAVFRPFENTWNGIHDYGRLKKAYEEARDRADAYEASSIEAEAQLRELNNLRAEFGLPTCSLIPRVTAEVVGRPATNYESSIEISKGRRNGVKQGMPVITSGGLVGRVGKVSEARAFIQLLNEPDLKVRVQISGTKGAKKDAKGQLEEGPGLLPTTTAAGASTSGTTTPSTTAVPTSSTVSLDGVSPEVDPALASSSTTTTTIAPTTTAKPVPIEDGLMHGNGPGKELSVDFIDSASPVRVGDPVATVSDARSLFPGCIPVGTVASVSPRSGSTQALVTVKPTADLGRVNIVTVLLYDPDAIQQGPTTTVPPVPSS